MTPTKRTKKGAEVREMPSPIGDNTPESPEKPAPNMTESAPRGFPAPKKFDLAPVEFFKYWIECDLLFPGRLVVYVYRKLPVTDVTQPLSEEELRLIQQKKKKEPTINISVEKLAPFSDPEQWNRWVCETFGAGDYHFKLNDHHPSVKKTIAMTTTKGEGSLRDWNSFPPVLHHNEAGELDEVVLNDPLNESYLRWARLNGIKFPGDPGSEAITESQTEGEEMASVVEAVMKQNEKLNEKVLQMSERQQAAPAVPPMDAAARGQLGAVETVVEGAKQAMSVMGGAMKQVIDNQVKASDPDERLRQSIEIAKLMVPQGNGNSDIVATMKMQMDSQATMMKLQMDMQEKNFERILKMQSDAHKESMEMMKSRLDKVEAERTSAPGGKAVNELDMLDRLIQYKQKTDEFLETNAPVASGPAWLEPTLNFAEKAMGNIVTGLQTLAALRNAPQANGNGAPPVAAAELPAAKAPEEDPETKERRRYAQLIHPHLVAAMKVHTPGHEFAASLIAQVGEPTYNGLSQNGYQGLIDFLRLHPPLYQELMQPPIGGAVLDHFIGEFLDRQKVMACVGMLKDGEKPAAKHSGPQVAN